MMRAIEGQTRRPPTCFRSSPTHEQKQLHVDRRSRIAAALDERRNVLASDKMDGDVLMLVAPALSDLAHSVGAHEREAFGHHSRRAVELPQPCDPLGSKACLLF